MRRYSWIAFIAVALVVLSTSGFAATQKPAPEIALTGPDGARIQLDAYRGKVLLVDFWASWCIPCKASFPELDVLNRAYQPKGLEVFAVNVDERRRDADAFLAMHPNHLRVLFDAKGSAALAFNVQGMPSSFLIDKTGNIRFTHMGYSADVAVRYREEIEALLKE